MRKRKNESLFAATHHFKNDRNAKEAKSEMLVNTAILNYDLAQCFKRYLQRLHRISPLSYHAQAESIREQMMVLYKNAQTYSESKVANK